jgi:hypothetical protein
MAVTPPASHHDACRDPPIVAVGQHPTAEATPEYAACRFGVGTSLWCDAHARFAK